LLTNRGEVSGAAPTQLIAAVIEDLGTNAERHVANPIGLASSPTMEFGL
jgi:hypothetical protein